MKTYSTIIFATLILAGCTQSDGADPDMGDEPVQVVELLDTQRFEDLDDMVQSSDAVIVAHVLEVGPGEIRGVEADGTGGIQFAESTLQVEAVLAGSVDTETVVIESLGWADYGRSYEFADGSTHQSHVAGERAIFHLVRTRRPDDRVVYRLTSSQGKYLLDEAGTLTATKTNDELASRIATLDLAELRTRVAAMAPIE